MAWASPDRLAKRRNAGTGSYLLRCGFGGALEKEDPLIREQCLVAVELQDGSANAKIRLAVPIRFSEITEFFEHLRKTESVDFWDKKIESVQSLRRIRLGVLVLAENKDRMPDPER